MFKAKSTKKHHSDNRMTLTAKDKQVRSSFKTKQTKVSKLKKDKATIKARIHKLSNARTPDEFTILHALKQKLRAIKKDIARLKEATDVTKHDIKTHRLMSEYITRCQEQSNSKERRRFFFTTPGPKAVSKKSRTRADILDEYMHTVDDDYMPKASRKKKFVIAHNCVNCATLCRIDPMHAELTCTNCGCVQSYLDSDINPPSFKELDQKNMSHSYGYQRSNHFSEWLSQFQAKERKEIPEEVYNQIRNEMKKAQFTEFDKLTPKRTHDFLKKLGLQPYYDHIPYIMSAINGIPPPCLNPETENMLKKMFQMVQKPWEAVRLPTRKNFLSYSYTIHKFCELLELDHLLKYFPLLKNIDRLREQDQYWKKICAILKWEYYPSV